ncbi:NAD(P)H-dependent oxidoreductase [filamentous cyanobacterium LEGE 11480]|uniref:NAD(P)H-dependent oxidoreductase n=1 Tax=Romeriopsis navalis LEGE 11480 TaxID=2777977 RepID=A0A928Z4V4_9CYAN|nr:NAD(P)H-dependent oxidoreductase [Romeriopsis navalis]MBE9030590.1 NAD(P)H-dependent oxidoreductase [Romeriopsis navalis LEGE 11480]
MISSPEYAHGIAGSLKNGLDWLVGSGEFVHKPVMLINASLRATIAQASLAEILTTMAAKVINPCCITLPIMGSGLDATGIVDTPELAEVLARSLSDFAKHLH